MYLKEILELPASINWCEVKNTHSIYISEFWNTITGLALCISAIINLYENKKSGHTILFFSNYTLFIVGIGTMLFHGTLLYVFQLLDELPMLLIAFDYYNILVKLDIVKRMYNYSEINTDILKFNQFKLNFYHIAILIISSYFLHTSLQIVLFQGILGIIIITIFWIMYNLNKNINRFFYNKLKKLKTKNDDMYNEFKTTSLSTFYKKKQSFDYITYLKKINHVKLTYNQDNYKEYFKLKYSLQYNNKIGIYIFVFSLTIWNIENFHCNNVQFLQLHALWHISTSIGTYILNNIMKIFIEIDKIID